MQSNVIFNQIIIKVALEYVMNYVLENGYLMNGLYILNNHLITSLPITLILRNLNQMI